MISISLRSTGHPPSFQPRSVRPSTRSYPRFSLPMDSSLSFGSTACDSNRPVRTRFRYGSAHRLTLPQTSNSPARYAKSTPSQHEAAPTACRHAVSGTISLPFRGTFHLSSRYLSAIGHQGVLSLGGWSPQVQTAFHGCGPTQEPHREAVQFRLRDDCPLWCAVPRASPTTQLCNSRQKCQLLDRGPTTPGAQRLTACTHPVWADPLSLATTQGVSIDLLSSGY